MVIQRSARRSWLSLAGEIVSLVCVYVSKEDDNESARQPEIQSLESSGAGV